MCKAIFQKEYLLILLKNFKFLAYNYFLMRIQYLTPMIDLIFVNIRSVVINPHHHQV